MTRVTKTLSFAATIGFFPIWAEHALGMTITVMPPPPTTLAICGPLLDLALFAGALAFPLQPTTAGHSARRAWKAATADARKAKTAAGCAKMWKCPNMLALGL